MGSTKRIGFGKRRLVSLVIVLPFAILTACDSKLVKEAREAERDGRTINNAAMLANYPQSFHPGSPEYLERDFEAGADMICNEIKEKYQRDMCSEPEINWR